eukprot:GILI01038394.1.p1 GENE.GILI01038394.1~~GILI01038394.1.p1  ORF type:complete len:389 (+),score=69.15 GILI01038394.1:125-1168(+)
MKWFGKPLQASPVECARNGYINTAVDQVACEVCNTKLHLNLSEDLDQISRDSAAFEFHKLLLSSHKPLCPWLDSTCPLSVCLFESSELPDFTSDFKSRLAALKGLEALPAIDPSAAELLNQEEKDLLHTFTNSPLNVVLIALFGWSTVQEARRSSFEPPASASAAASAHPSSSITLHCHFCQRQAPAPLPAPSTAPANPSDSRKRPREESGVVEEHDSSKRPRSDNSPLSSLSQAESSSSSSLCTSALSCPSPFQLLDEHRWFCPWIQGLVVFTESTASAPPVEPTAEELPAPAATLVHSPVMGQPGWSQCLQEIVKVQKMKSSVSPVAADASSTISAIRSLVKMLS